MDSCVRSTPMHLSMENLHFWSRTRSIFLIKLIKVISDVFDRPRLDPGQISLVLLWKLCAYDVWDYRTFVPPCVAHVGWFHYSEQTLIDLSKWHIVIAPNNDTTIEKRFNLNCNLSMRFCNGDIYYRRLIVHRVLSIETQRFSETIFHISLCLNRKTLALQSRYPQRFLVEDYKFEPYDTFNTTATATRLKGFPCARETEPGAGMTRPTLYTKELLTDLIRPYVHNITI